MISSNLSGYKKITPQTLRVKHSALITQMTIEGPKQSLSSKCLFTTARLTANQLQGLCI